MDAVGLWSRFRSSGTRSGRDLALCARGDEELNRAAAELLNESRADVIAVKTTFATTAIVDGVHYVFLRAASLGKNANC